MSAGLWGLVVVWTYHLGRLSHGRSQKAVGVQQRQYSAGWRQREQRELENRAKSEKWYFGMILVHYFFCIQPQLVYIHFRKVQKSETIMQSHHPGIITVHFLPPT